jgi:hypothetical protein
MTADGFTEYKRREFCKDVKCPVQTELNSLAEGSAAYEKTRAKCGSSCLYTTWQFHHWLIEKGYLLLKNAELKGNERTVMVNLDKALADWVDKQVAEGKDRNRLVADALEQYRLKQKRA